LGNNNPYCQDNELSWLNWDLDQSQQKFLEFCRRLTSLWHSQPVLRRRKFFLGRHIGGASVKDISWLHHDGEEISNELWHSDELRALGMRLNGASIDEVDERGVPVSGDTLLVILNQRDEDVPFTMPRQRDSEVWVPVVDTDNDPPAPVPLAAGDTRIVTSRSVVVFLLKSSGDTATPPADHVR